MVPEDKRAVYVGERKRTDVLDALGAVVDAVDHASTLAAAVEHLEGASCVVTGTRLPDATDSEVVERLRAEGSAPIVVFTAHGSEALAGELIAAGADAYVPADAGLETLTTRVSELVGADSTRATAGPDRDETTARLEALQASTRDLLRAKSRTEIGEIAVRTVADVIEQPRASVWLSDEATDRLTFVAGVGEPFWESEHSGAETDAEPFRRAIEEGAPIESDALANMGADDPTSAPPVVCYPLGEHGVLAVGSTESDALEGPDRWVLRILAATTRAALDGVERRRELERAETIVETVGDTVYSLDDEGRFVTVNDTLVATCGYSKEELIGAHVSKIASPESVERGEREIERLLREPDDEVATYEVTILPADGGQLPCEVSTTLLRSDGEFVGSVGVMRDISDRKQIERALREQQRKTTALHEVASRLEHTDSERALFEEAVAAAREVLDFDVCLIGTAEEDVDEAVFRTRAFAAVDDEVSIADRHPITGLAGRVFRTGETFRTRSLAADPRYGRGGEEPEEALLAKDFESVLSVPIGEYGVLQAASTETAAFDGRDQELAELLVTHVVDSLERMAFEDRLRDERDRFAALFENVPDAVVSARLEDGEPIVERVNPAFEHVFGYEEAELVGESLDRYLVPADDEAATRLNRSSLEGEIGEAEAKRRTADGLRDFMLRIVPIDVESEGDGPRRAFGVYTDVTERKQRQKRVEILNRVLRHDLRNGMNIINGCAEMLVDDLEDANQQYAEAIQERASELIGLAEKTRAVERTLDRGTVAAAPVDVVDAVETAVEAVKATYDDVDVTVTAPERAFARADDMLETAIGHVIENTADHNDLPRTVVEVTITEGEDTLELSVADNGPGVPAEERALLQEEKEITQLRHASGLGLWFVNWVVTQSGGTLRFADNDPRGTVVTLEIPMADPPAAAVGSDASAAVD